MCIISLPPKSAENCAVAAAPLRGSGRSGAVSDGPGRGARDFGLRAAGVEVFFNEGFVLIRLMHSYMCNHVISCNIM